MKVNYFFIIFFIISGCVNHSSSFIQKSAQISNNENHTALPPLNIKEADINLIAKRSSTHKETVRKVLHAARTNNVNLIAHPNEEQLKKIAIESSVNKNQTYQIINEARKILKNEDLLNNSDNNLNRVGTVGPGPGIRR
ncbi:MAG: hypothetical protein HYX61_05290 [Gammaproteobacteria bacterium]|jgi:hypothetical protein|nr:hypothetical protein [Gammaproteobacteria bacterium]